MKKDTFSMPKEEKQGFRREEDCTYWKEMDSILNDFNHSYQHILLQWPVYVRRLNLSRFLALYELFKQTIELPGDIVDLGVYRGCSFFTWSKLLETFNTTDRRKKVFGFDHFKGLIDFHEKDGATSASDSKAVGGFNAAPVKEEVERLVKLHNYDNLISGVERCHLIEGNIMETIPQFLEKNPGLRICLAHFDMDLYEPTKFALEQLYPLVITGGLVVFDEYALIPWQGESLAAEEYFDSIGEKPKFKKFPFTPTPNAYFVKGE